MEGQFDPATIRQSSLFAHVKQAVFEHALVSGIVRSVEEKGYFFMQGDPAHFAYVLTHGRVKMVEYTPYGQQIILRILEPGQTFGGISLFNPEEGYPVSALAIEDSQAVAWSTAALRELSQQDEAIPLNVMQLMHGYIQELQSRQQALVSERVEQRIAHILLKLAAQIGQKVPEGILINMPLSRQDVAEMSGTTLYTVSRTLSAWEKLGLVCIGRERVIICNPHELVRIGDHLH